MKTADKGREARFLQESSKYKGSAVKLEEILIVNC